MFRESSNFSKETFPRSFRVSKVTITPLNALNFDSGPESIDRSFLDSPRSSIDRCSSLLPRSALNFPSELSKDMRPLRNWQIPPRVNSLLRRKKDISLFTPRLNPFTRIFTFQLVSIWRKKKKGQFLQSNFLRRENNFNGKNIKMYIIVFAIVIFSWYFLFKHLSFINGSLSVNETRNRVRNTSITVCFVALQNPRPVGTNGGPTTEFQVSP